MCSIKFFTHTLSALQSIPFEVLATNSNAFRLSGLYSSNTLSSLFVIFLAHLQDIPLFSDILNYSDEYDINITK